MCSTPWRAVGLRLSLGSRSAASRDAGCGAARPSSGSAKDRHRRPRRQRLSHRAEQQYADSRHHRGQSSDTALCAACRPEAHRAASADLHGAHDGYALRGGAAERRRRQRAGARQRLEAALPLARRPGLDPARQGREPARTSARRGRGRGAARRAAAAASVAACPAGRGGQRCRVDARRAAMRSPRCRFRLRRSRPQVARASLRLPLSSSRRRRLRPRPTTRLQAKAR